MVRKGGSLIPSLAGWLANRCMDRLVTKCDTEPSVYIKGLQLF